VIFILTSVRRTPRLYLFVFCIGLTFFRLYDNINLYIYVNRDLFEAFNGNF